MTRWLLEGVTFARRDTPYGIGSSRKPSSSLPLLSLTMWGGPVAWVGSPGSATGRALVRVSVKRGASTEAQCMLLFVLHLGCTLSWLKPLSRDAALRSHLHL